MTGFRDAPDEQARIASLLRLLPPGGRALEIGARDGYITRLLAERHDEVVALDLERPHLAIPRVTCVAGDVRSLDWPTDSFDAVLCSEVLEHIPPIGLLPACRELARVTRKHLLIGVPFKQDLRVARSRCQRCGAINPPYGHVNRFDEIRLKALFTPLLTSSVELVASTREGTNWLSDVLMRAAGYPWGTYDQDESCIVCGAAVGPAPPRSNSAKAISSAAIRLDRLLYRWRKPHAKWIHVAFAKVQHSTDTGYRSNHLVRSPVTGCD